MQLSVDQVVQDCLKTIQDKINNLTTLNLIVAGKTGSGKSTLINSVFRDDLTETGIGRPVTAHMQRIEKKGVPLVVYDTKGFELGKSAQKEVKDEIMKTIRDANARNDVNEAIHCIWYCINAASNRIEAEEIEWLRELGAKNGAARVPIIVVLTQCLSKKNAQQMRSAVENENLDVVQIVPVLAQDYEIDDGYVARAFGLDVLVKVMSEALPDELLDTLQSMQKVDLEQKAKLAHKAVVTATAAAVAAGAAPIPIADATVLVPIQISMLGSIAAVFNVQIDKTVLTTFVSTTLGSGGATLLGRTVVSNLLKLIPGAGTVVGGAISGSTAGLLTTALGETFILVMTRMYKGQIQPGDLQTAQGKKFIADTFKQQLQRLPRGKRPEELSPAESTESISEK